MSCFFPKSLRLLKRSEFQQTWRQGRKKHTPHFIVVIHRHGGETSRLGITASRKTGNAVARNRIKRLVREFFRTQFSFLNEGADISVIAKQGAARLDYAAVRCELGGLFRDEGLVS
ncbi:MAG: ribonuclease P protein component [Desulfuromonas sp.]|nr:MAG: ribonuclease P protein component [Desulfuromonas sp.]